MIENTLECDFLAVDEIRSAVESPITGELSCGEIGAVPYELLLTQADVGQLQMRLREPLVHRQNRPRIRLVGR